MNAPRKPGFNIDDILQQHSDSLAQYQSNKSTASSANAEGCFEDYAESMAVPRWPYLTARPESVAYDSIYSASLPFYQHMIELQKTSSMVPFPFVLPDTTSYSLQQYGNVMEKGFSTLPTFYPHPYPTYYIPAGGSKRKGGQIRFTPQQTRSLENRFASAKYLSPEDRRHLAIQLKLSDRQVKTWFQNRRAKYRRSNNGISGSPRQEPGGEGACGNSTDHKTCPSPFTPQDSHSTEDDSSSNEHFELATAVQITPTSATS